MSKKEFDALVQVVSISAHDANKINLTLSVEKNALESVLEKIGNRVRIVIGE